MSGKILPDGRIYLPQEDLARPFPKRSCKIDHIGDRFVRLMEFEAARARSFLSRGRGASG